MRRLLRAWNAYWYRPASLVNLAVCRVAVLGFIVVSQYYLPGGYRGGLEELAALPIEMYDALPALHVLVWPWGWTYRPSLEVLQAVYALSLVAGTAALAGFVTNLALAATFVGSLFLHTHAYSYGDFHHVWALVILSVGILAFAPAGRRLSLDALLGRRRPWWPRLWSWRVEGDGSEPARSAYAGWPLRLIGWLLSLAYLSAAWSKVNPVKGLEWLNGFTLQRSLLQDGLRWESELGVWLAHQHEVAVLLSWATVLFEATFFLVMIVPRLRWLYLPAGVALHVGILLTMRAPFWSFLVLYSALVPWDRAWHEAKVRLGRDERRVPKPG